jgi:hypothetical protein
VKKQVNPPRPPNKFVSVTYITQKKADIIVLAISLFPKKEFTLVVINGQNLGRLVLSK